MWREGLVDIKVVIMKVHKPTKVDLVGAAGHVEGATGATDVRWSGDGSLQGAYGD